MVEVTATYDGADAETVNDAVATPVAQAVMGVNDMLYMQATSANDGSMSLQVTFEIGSDPDMDAILTQNNVATATAELPAAVTRQGVTTRKTMTGFLMVYSLHSDGRYDDEYLANYAYINLQNRMPGKEIVILGSGDIGLIMARRLTLEGAHVIGVFEINPIPSGLPRNIEQCLHDYDIPLAMSHTVTDIRGTDRLESVVISEVDDKLQPIAGTEKEYACDTLILSVGLIPENELTIGAGAQLDPHTKGALVDEFYQTTVPGLFAAGNVLHVHDLVDFVSMEAETMADGITRYIKEGLPEKDIPVKCGNNIGHVIPQRVSGSADFKFSFRMPTL